MRSQVGIERLGLIWGPQGVQQTWVPLCGICAQELFTEIGGVEIGLDVGSLPVISRDYEVVIA